MLTLCQKYRKIAHLKQKKGRPPIGDLPEATPGIEPGMRVLQKYILWLQTIDFTSFFISWTHSWTHLVQIVFQRILVYSY